VCRTRASTSAAFNFNFSAASLNCAHTFAARTSSQVVSASISSAASKAKAGKSFSLSFWIISFAFVMPSAIISRIVSSILAAFILTISATLLIPAHTVAPRISSHLKSVAISTSCLRTCAMISVVFVIPC